VLAPKSEQLDQLNSCEEDGISVGVPEDISLIHTPPLHYFQKKVSDSSQLTLRENVPSVSNKRYRVGQKSVESKVSISKTSKRGGGKSGDDSFFSSEDMMDKKGGRLPMNLSKESLQGGDNSDNNPIMDTSIARQAILEE
jgi:hypothetical protein